MIPARRQEPDIRRAMQEANKRQMQELQAANERKLQEMQKKFDRSKQDAEKRYEEIKANAEASAQSKLADLQKLLDEETASIKKLTDEAKKAGMDSATVNAEMRRNREALTAIQLCGPTKLNAGSGLLVLPYAEGSSVT